jgi:hypothetical protein
MADSIYEIMNLSLEKCRAPVYMQCNINRSKEPAVDTLSSIVCVAIFLILAAPIIEIAVKRPRIFLEMTAGSRAFAEATVPESDSTGSPAAGRRLGVLLSDGERLAA